MKTVYDMLQDTFDETCETYLEQNPGLEIEQPEKKVFDKLKSNNRQVLISQCHDLIQMGNILKRLCPQANNSYDLKRIMIWQKVIYGPLKRENSSWEEYWTFMNHQNCQ